MCLFQEEKISLVKSLQLFSFYTKSMSLVKKRSSTATATAASAARSMLVQIALICDGDGGDAAAAAGIVKCCRLTGCF